MRVVYMAHPVSGDVENNLVSARAWIRWIEENFENVAVVASWILECEIWDDADPKQREAGLQRDCAVLEKCDELWLVGPRVSPGMDVERNHARSRGMRVRDLTTLRKEWPPTSGRSVCHVKIQKRCCRCKTLIDSGDNCIPCGFEILEERRIEREKAQAMHIDTKDCES